MASRYQDDLIFDVGAHRGEDTAFYLLLGYKVVAVEANPELTQVLRARFSHEIAQGRLRVVEAAIAREHGQTTFYRNKALSVWGTTIREWAQRNERLGASSTPIVVRGIPFEDVIDSFGCPHYMKVDIEGSDLLCLEALRCFESRPKFVSIESNKTSWEDLLHEFRILNELGYRRFQVVDQREHRPGVFKTRGGEMASYAFPPGASGPFGEQLPGKWVTEQQALNMYRKIFRRYRLFGDESWLRKFLVRCKLDDLIRLPASWYDTHASLGDCDLDWNSKAERPPG